MVHAIVHLKLSPLWGNAPTRGPLRMLNQQSRGFFLYFFKAYPGRTSLMVALLLGSGLSEGIGIAALLPVLELGAASAGGDPSQIALMVDRAFRAIGLAPTLGPLLVVIVIAMGLKG
ncbi:MAG: hypothetical protein ABIF09_18865, partial [Gemmatimonadota bacterium]